MPKLSRDIKTEDQILQYIISYIQDHCYAPTVREIADGVGLHSTSSTHAYIIRLLEKGLIETDTYPCMPRAIRVPGYRFVKEEK